MSLAVRAITKPAFSTEISGCKSLISNKPQFIRLSDHGWGGVGMGLKIKK